MFRIVGKSKQKYSIWKKNSASTILTFINPKTQFVLPLFAEYIHIIYQSLITAKVQYKQINDRQRLSYSLLEASFPTSIKKKLLEFKELTELKKHDNFWTECHKYMGYGQDIYKYLKYTETNFSQFTLLNQNLENLEKLFQIDFLSLLQLFDPQYPANPKQYMMQFVPTHIETIMPDLVDIDQALAYLSFDVHSWEQIRHLLNFTNPSFYLDKKDWHMILQTIRYLQNHKIISLIIVEARQSLEYATTSDSKIKQPVVTSQKIILEYLSSLEKIENSLKIGKKNNTIMNSLYVKEKKLFSTPKNILINYTETNSQLLEWNISFSFTFAGLLNYVLLFHEIYYKPKLEPVLETLLLKGQWKMRNFRNQLAKSHEEYQNLIETVFLIDRNLLTDTKLFSGIYSYKKTAETTSIKKKYPLSKAENRQIVTSHENLRNTVIQIITSLSTLNKNLHFLHDDMKQKIKYPAISNWPQLYKTSFPENTMFRIFFSDSINNLYSLLELLHLEVQRQQNR